MQNTRLYTQPGFNPFLMDGKVLSSICFYKDGEVVASVRWFGSNNNYKSLELPFEVKKAVRLNLERRDAFYMRDKDATYSPEYILYIPADFVNLQHIETANNNAGGWSMTGTHEVFSVELTGERWKPYINKETGRLAYIEEFGTYTEKFDYNYIWTDTPEFTKCKELSQAIKESAAVDLSAYQIHDILEHYDIIKK